MLIQKLNEKYNKKIEKNILNKSKFVINFNNNFLRIWEIVNLLFIIYSITIVSFITAFYNHNYNNIFFIIEIILDIFYIIDFIKNFFQPIIINSEIVYNHKKIITNYLLGYFTLDFITAIPFSTYFYFKYDIIMNSDNITNINLRFFRLFKLIRILKFLKNINSYIDFIFFNVEIKSHIRRIMITILISIALFHSIACLWVFIAQINIIDNWIFESEIYYFDIFSIYITAFYWTVQTISTVGYGNYSAVNIYERGIAIFIMFSGAFIFSFIIGSISSIINISNNISNYYLKYLKTLNSKL